MTASDGNDRWVAPISVRTVSPTSQTLQGGAFTAEANLL